LGGGYWLGQSGDKVPALQSAALELRIPDSAVVIGTREGAPQALVDIAPVNATLRSLDNGAREASVRQAVNTLAKGWYDTGKVAKDVRIPVEVVTITKRDE